MFLIKKKTVSEIYEDEIPFLTHIKFPGQGKDWTGAC
jgi:hypothetical protein